MKYKCSECNEVFTEREARCEDWRNPEKSFACPKCHTFFRQKTSQRKKPSLIAGIAAGGIWVPAMHMVFQAANRGDKVGIVSGCVILLSCIAILVISSWGNLDFSANLEKVEAKEAT